MWLPRLSGRIASAVPVGAGYVAGRRLAFHKRGLDGSAKADAVYTGHAGDRVWGVVFAMTNTDKWVLSGYECDYDEQEVVVIGENEVHAAIIYVARAEAVDPTLEPFCWYHRFVLQGARQHQLPDEYIEALQGVPSIPDPDRERHERNVRLIGRQ
jgi:hypothetical protein